MLWYAAVRAGVLAVVILAVGYQSSRLLRITIVGVS